MLISSENEEQLRPEVGVVPDGEKPALRDTLAAAAMLTHQSTQ